MKIEACGRSGLIYEPIAGKLLTDQILTKLWLFQSQQPIAGRFSTRQCVMKRSDTRQKAVHNIAPNLTGNKCVGVPCCEGQ
jgi:hypothetical protein